jgi:hypothetical protein
MAVTFTKKDKKPEAIEVEPVIANTSLEVKNGGTVVKHLETEEHLEDVLSNKPMANIGFTGARTFNLGNYNSAKIQVSLHFPCDIDSLDETYEKVRSWVDSKMESISKELEV